MRQRKEDEERGILKQRKKRLLRLEGAEPLKQRLPKK